MSTRRASLSMLRRPQVAGALPRLARLGPPGLALVATLVACGSNLPDGPSLSSFGANSNDLTDGQTVRVTAVLSDGSQGAAAAGFRGVLTDAGGLVYGTFSPSMPGVFTFDLSWDQVNASKGIAFASEDVRSYTAEFVDDLGHKIVKPFTLRLHCTGRPACEGRCVTAGDACPISKSLQCFAGQCGVGCVSSSGAALDGAQNPANPCEKCDAAVSRTRFSAAPPYTECKAGLSCSYDGQCKIPFRRRAVSSTASPVFRLSAPSAQLQVGLSGSGLGNYVALTAPGAGMSFSPPGVGSLNDLFVLDAANLYAVRSTSFLRSGDGGQNFSAVTPSGAASLTAIWASGPSDLWVGDGSSAVFRSTDNGQTFVKTKATGATGAVKLIWGSGPNNVYVVTNDDRVYRTTDLGQTYNYVTRFDTVRAFWGTGASDIYVADNSGFSRSTNNLLTTTIIPPPPNSAPSYTFGGSVHGCGPNEVYFASVQGEVWRSTNGGVTTTLIPTTGLTFNTPSWYAVACTAPGKLLVGGDGGGPAPRTPLILESF